MSKVIWKESFGINGIENFPMCSKCNEPTYSKEKCSFCGEELEYE